MRKLFVASALLFSSLTFAGEDVIIENAFARAVPPGQPNSAAFMTLDNHGHHDASLVSASSSVAEVTELHTHTDVDGVMQMRQIDTIEIPAGQQTHLQPGGLHVMLIGLKQNLADGDQIDLTLTFADGSEKALEIPVRHAMPVHSDGHQHSHDHSHSHSH